MKKFINDPFEVTNELVEGFVLANERNFRKLDGMNVVVRKDIPKKKKATIVIGGGANPFIAQMLTLSPGNLGDFIQVTQSVGQNWD